MTTNDILTLAAIGLVMIIAILGFIYWNMGRKEKGHQHTTIKEDKKTNSDGKGKSISSYTKLSIFNFMEFDKIEDNMIIQNDGKRYLMAIEFEGINYDLMSEIEKTSVEQGFIQFLNTLRHPIQLYIQTRTINISSSIENYNYKLESIRQELVAKQNEYNKILQDGMGTAKVVNNLKYEIARMQNLYDYGKDIVSNTEKMSLNKNVLRKHYYVIIPYYEAELGATFADEEEKRNMIFAELYTRAQAIIRTLFACSMKGKILDSNELAELIYVALNRDEAEVYGIDKAIRAGYTELYSTAPDVLDKRMEAINNVINEKALKKAKFAVEEARSEKQKELEKKEKNLDELVDELAKVMIKENERYIGKDIANNAMNKINKTAKEESANEKKAKARRTAQ